MAHAQDDGFHEIQLNGKQLVFLFMAATVVFVVIFLCGVLVGRGVRAERGVAAEATAAGSGADLTAAQPAPAGITPAESDPRKAAPPPEAKDLTYFKRLEQKNDPVESLPPPPRESRTASAKQATLPRDPGAASSRQASPPVRSSTAAASHGAASSSRTEPSVASTTKTGTAAPTAKTETSSSQIPTQAPGSGYAVQVAALNARAEADAIAKRLARKGYAAYVLAPASGTPAVYRVRVGAFRTRREAETVAAKLQKEEQFRPWVTR